MILPLRRLHRGAFLALGALLPVLLVSAWRARRAPVVGELPPELLPGALPPDAGTADELVYWSALEGADALPEDARLRGTVRSGALTVPPPPGQHVYLYDLAHGSLRAAGGRR